MTPSTDINLGELEFKAEDFRFLNDTDSRFCDEMAAETANAILKAKLKDVKRVYGQRGDSQLWKTHKTLPFKGISSVTGMYHEAKEEEFQALVICIEPIHREKTNE